jgi:hypothetical protein
VFENDKKIMAVVFDGNEYYKMLKKLEWYKI